jgi:hypothetical protein
LQEQAKRYEDTLMSTELFVELNSEQQEVITGGASVINFSDTYFAQHNVVGQTYSASGPGGSVAYSFGAGQSIKTDGLSYLDIMA